jgi:hypothetical protein
MYSKEEAQQIKKEFWIAFATAYPRKWMLYDTKIKDFSFKFYVDSKKAQVILDIEVKNDETRIVYFEKIVSLKNILQEEYLREVLFERNFYLENGKVISRIWVEKTDGISLNNQNSWPVIFAFFNEKMNYFESFYEEYQDYIKDLNSNR